MKLAILLAVIVASPAAAADPVAIRCIGAYKTTDGETKKVTISNEPRVYIIDEDKKVVSYWNDNFGKAFSLCETYGHACEFEFAPNMIMASPAAVDRDTLSVMIDRKNGTFWELGYSVLGRYEYRAICAKTAMPTADPAARKF